MSAPDMLTEEERLELELAEQARLSSGDWNSVAPGKAANFGKSFGRLIGLLKPHAVAFILVSILGAIGVVLAVIAPKVLGEATNIIFEGVISSSLGAQFPAGTSQEVVVETLRAAGQTDLANMVSAMRDFTVGAGVDFDALRMVIVAVLAIYVVSALLTWIQGYVINVIMVRTMWRLRESVEAKINRLPLSYFDKVQRGELISRVTNDIDNITQTMQQSLSTVVTSVLTVIGVLFMMFSISWQLALVALVSLPLMARHLRRDRSALAEGVRHPVAQGRPPERPRRGVVLGPRAGEGVRSRGRLAPRSSQVENEELYEAAFKAQFLSGIIMPGMMFIGNLTYVGIAVLGGIMVANGQLRLGDVQAFIQYSQQFTQPLSELGGMAAVVQSGTASAERVFELLDADEQEPDAEDAPELADGRGRHRVQGRAVLVHARAPAHHRPVVPGRARPDGRDRRPDRCRQDDAGEPHHAVLRAQRRPDPARRAGHRRAHPRRRPLAHRHGAAGSVAVRRDDPRQHPLRPRVGDRRRGRRCRQGDARRPVRALAARRLRHRARRGRLERLGG